MGLQWVVAVPMALIGAASFGGAGLLQHRAAQEVPERGPLQPVLLRDLLRLGTFRWGVLLSASGFGLQIAALRFAPLPVVQPLLVTGVLFYLGFAHVFLGYGVDRILVLGALLALIGLSGFLLAAAPSAGDASLDRGAAVRLGTALVVLVTACLLVSRRLPRELRTLPVAVATAACYGTTAALVRSLLVHAELGNVLTHWELYAVVLLGPTGFLLNQNAFQEGTVGSVAVATITVGDPVFSILIGVTWLGDALTGGPWRTTGAALALVLMAAGVVVLTGRAQQVADRIRSHDSPGSAAGNDARGPSR